MSAPLGNIRVLHVDDQPDFLEMAADFLERQTDRVVVETATSADEALERLHQGNIDCIVSDYDMPGADGIDFLLTVREEYPDLPFILYTGKGSEEVASEAISAGVTDYLQKDAGTSQYEVLANRIQNVVEHHRARVEAMETEERLQTIAEHTNDILWKFSGDWTELRFINSAYEDIWGRSIDELRDRPQSFLEGIHPEDRKRAEDAMCRLSAGESVDIEYRVNADEDFGRWIWAQGEPVFDDDGQVTKVVGFARDITDRVEYEQRIEALHTTAKDVMAADTAHEVADIVGSAIRDILDMPVNGIWYHDEAENVLRPVTWTEVGETVVGEPPSFHPGESLAWEAFETGETAYYPEVSSQPDRLNPDTPIRSEILLPIGTHGLITIGSTEPDAFDATDVSMARTLTAHTETALDNITHVQAREPGEGGYRTVTEDVLDRSPVGTFILDSDFDIVWINRAIEDFFDIDREAVIGSDKRQLIDDHIADVVEDGTKFAETVLATYDDNSYVEEFECHILPDGERAERWLEHWSRPIESGLNQGGRIEHYTDITDQHAYEQRLERQNDRLEAFASVVSHDLRNPLNVAVGRLEMVQDDCESEEVRVARQSLDRMQTLIEDLLTLAREGDDVGSFEPVDLADISQQCWMNVDTGAASFRASATHIIRADASRLAQLLENLIRNAVEHGGGKVSVTVGDLDDGFYVADDGPGIPAADRQAVLEAGYSTLAEGTGFGLTIVREIAAAHGWDLSVTAAAEGGTQFEFTGVRLA